MTVHSRILGTGSYLPQRRVSNADLAAQLAQDGIETSDAWIQERTGIQARHFAEPGQKSSDLALPAAQAEQAPTGGAPAGGNPAPVAPGTAPAQPQQAPAQSQPPK